MIVRYLSAIVLCCVLTMPAIAAVKSSTDKIADAFMQLDLDASEAVSFEEYKAMVDERAQTRFAAMDRNHDGEVTDAEYRIFWRENKAKWYRLQR